MRPGRGESRRMRSARTSASSTLWVTKTTVGPAAPPVSRRSSACISSRDWASRAAKGSSISRSSGSARERAGERHALLHAARELARPGVGEAGEADPRQHARRRGRRARARARCGEREGDVGADASSRAAAGRTGRPLPRPRPGTGGGAVHEDAGRRRGARRPATRRSSEVLPQPEGPSSTTSLAAAGGEVDAVEHRPCRRGVERDAGEREVGGVAQRRLSGSARRRLGGADLRQHVLERREVGPGVERAPARCRRSPRPRAARPAPPRARGG